MAVTSTPLTRDGIPIRQQRRHTPLGAIMGALVGLIIGAVVWLFGAKFTIDGLIIGSNAILRFFTFSYQIRIIADLYLWLAILPLFFSAVEWTCSPIGKSGVRHLGLILTWAVVVTVDLVSTVMGLTAGGGIPIVVWIVSFKIGLAALALILTFGPEWLIKSCWSLIITAIKDLFRR